MSYTPSFTETIHIRGARHCIRHWGQDTAPKLFMLHGKMDSSPTFQFVVDALRHDWHVIAPDWRGYGASDWESRSYWMHDYYADLEGLLAHFSPSEPANIVGHSMGASIGSIYAGIRPERVRKLVMLDFLGLKPGQHADAPGVIGGWLDALREQPKLRTYPDYASLARRLCASNPRLNERRADFLSRNTSRLRHDGQIELACDPWHKIPSPIPYRVEDIKAVWSKVEAPVLMVLADDGYVRRRFEHHRDEYRSRIESFRKVEVVTVEDSGHNVQHDQPEQVAAVIENFLLRES